MAVNAVKSFVTNLTISSFLDFKNICIIFYFSFLFIDSLPMLISQPIFVSMDETVFTASVL